MILVFGGAYQGKLDYVKENFDIKDEDILDLKDNDLDFDHKVLYNLDELVLKFIRKDINAITFMEGHLDDLKDKIIICTDLSCGVVPMDKEQRQLRDNTGKLMQILTRHSDEVIRVFCGLGEKIK